MLRAHFEMRCSASVHIYICVSMTVIMQICIYDHVSRYLCSISAIMCLNICDRFHLFVLGGQWHRVPADHRHGDAGQRCVSLRGHPQRPHQGPAAVPHIAERHRRPRCASAPVLPRLSLLSCEYPASFSLFSSLLHFWIVVLFL